MATTAVRAGNSGNARLGAKRLAVECAVRLGEIATRRFGEASLRRIVGRSLDIDRKDAFRRAINHAAEEGHGIGLIDCGSRAECYRDPSDSAACPSDSALKAVFHFR